MVNIIKNFSKNFKDRFAKKIDNSIHREFSKVHWWYIVGKNGNSPLEFDKNQDVEIAYLISQTAGEVPRDKKYINLDNQYFIISMDRGNENKCELIHSNRRFNKKLVRVVEEAGKHTRELLTTVNG